MEQDQFISLTLVDQPGCIRINTRYISHYRPFVDENNQVAGTIIDFASGDSHLVERHPGCIDQILGVAAVKEELTYLS